jgi:3D (Asp-Asp-Asp) domain-containing protein
MPATRNETQSAQEDGLMQNLPQRLWLGCICAGLTALGLLGSQAWWSAAQQAPPPATSASAAHAGAIPAVIGDRGPRPQIQGHFRLVDLASEAPAARPQHAQADAVPMVPVVRPANASPDGSYKIRMRVTAYCPCEKCCGRFADGITASGKKIGYNRGRFVAAPKRFAFWTRLEIPGYYGGQKVPVLDRGGAIKGNRLDVFFPTHAQAREFGVRWVTVTVHPPR